MPLSQSEILAAYTASGRLRQAINGAEISADYLGIPAHCMAVAISCGLEPLGHPAPNSPKQFARVDLEEKAQDRKWLAKVQGAIQAHWRRKHAAATKRTSAHRLSQWDSSTKKDDEGQTVILSQNKANKENP